MAAPKAGPSWHMAPAQRLAQRPCLVFFGSRGTPDGLSAGPQPGQVRARDPHPARANPRDRPGAGAWRGATEECHALATPQMS